MRKIVALLLLTVITLSLAGCGGSTDTADDFSPLFNEVYREFCAQIREKSYDDIFSLVNGLNYSMFVDKQTDSIFLQDETNFFVRLDFADDTLYSVVYSDHIYTVGAEYDEAQNKIVYYTRDELDGKGVEYVNGIKEQENFMGVYVKQALDAYEKTSRDGRMSEVQMQLDYAVNDGFIDCELTTSLPDGTEIDFIVDAQSGMLSYRTAKTENGRIEAERLGHDGFSLVAGEYTLIVAMRPPFLQNEAVRKVIGNYGEFLRGPLVEKSPVYQGGVMIMQSFDFVVE